MKKCRFDAKGAMMIRNIALRMNKKENNRLNEISSNNERNVGIAIKSVVPIAFVLVFAMCFLIILHVNSAFASTKSHNGLPSKGVIVTAFQQNWKSIAKECKQTYGPEGVKYVQVSPPEDHIKGTAWWTSYQPVSYNLNSKLGTEAE
ncbi:hypothetical protein HMPREF3208_00593, partial [Gardnerella vaginalis]